MHLDSESAAVVQTTTKVCADMLSYNALIIEARQHRQVVDMSAVGYTLSQECLHSLSHKRILGYNRSCLCVKVSKC